MSDTNENPTETIRDVNFYSEERNPLFDQTNPQPSGPERSSQGFEDVNLALYMPQSLVPLPLFNRKMTFLKEVKNSETLSNLPGRETQPMLDKPNLNNVPVFKRESATVSSYTFLCCREFTERSTFHANQILGRHSSSHLKVLKMPRMKSGFVSKASLDRQRQATRPDPSAQAGTSSGFDSSSRGKRTLKFKESSRPSKDTDKQMLNTLSYSETMGPSAFGRKTDLSDINTVFDLKTQMTDDRIPKEGEINLNPSAEFQALATKSAEIEPSSSPTRKTGGAAVEEALQATAEFINNEKDEPNIQSSEIVDPNDFEQNFRLKLQQVPDMKCNWFQFFNKFVYCSVSSLILSFDGEDYKVPFGVAKEILTSKENMDRFMKTTEFKSGGEYKIDATAFAEIRGSRVSSSIWFKNEQAYLNKKELRLWYSVIT